MAVSHGRGVIQHKLEIQTCTLCTVVHVEDFPGLLLGRDSAGASFRASQTLVGRQSSTFTNF